MTRIVSMCAMSEGARLQKEQNTGDAAIIAAHMSCRRNEDPAAASSLAAGAAANAE
jgi:hypothetical protein